MPHEHQVLIVEDDPEVQVALTLLLERAGYEVLVAGNGAEAIEAIDPTAPPRAVLVDLLMPGIVGHELLEYLRGDPALAAVPVAIISGSPQLAPAGYRVFAKPLDAGALLAFVRTPRSAPGDPDSRPAA